MDQWDNLLGMSGKYTRPAKIQRNSSGWRKAANVNTAATKRKNMAVGEQRPSSESRINIPTSTIT